VFRNVVPPGLVSGGNGPSDRRRYLEIVVLGCGAVYAVVARAPRVRVHQAMFEGPGRDCRKDRESLDSSYTQAHNLLKYSLLEAYILKYRYIRDLLYMVFRVSLACPVCIHACSAGISS